MRRDLCVLICIVTVCVGCGRVKNPTQTIATPTTIAPTAVPKTIERLQPTVKVEATIESNPSTPVPEVGDEETAVLPKPLKMEPTQHSNLSQADEVSDLVNLAFLEEKRFGRGAIHQVAYSPSGNEIAVATGTGVWLHHLDQNSESRFLEHASAVYDISWSPNIDKPQIVTSSEDHRIQIWDVNTGSVEATYSDCASASQSRRAAWSPDGTRLVQDCVITSVIDIATGQTISELDGPIGPAREISWSPDGKQLAVGSYKLGDQTYVASLGIWDADSGHLTKMLVSDETGQSIDAVSWSRDGTSIAVAVDPGSMIKTIQGMRRWLPSETGVVLVYDVRSAEVLSTISLEGTARSLSWSLDSHKIATSAENVRIWDVDSQTLGMALSNDGHVVSLSWSPDGDSLVGGSLEGTVRVWNAETGQELLSFDGYRSVGRSVYWSPDDGRVASIDAVGTLNMWDTNSGASISSPSSPLVLSLSPDWSRFVTRIHASNAQVRDLVSEEVVTNLSGVPSGSVFQSITWSPNGKLIAALGDNFRIHVWNTDSGDELVIPINHTDYVSELSWAPDSEKLATASWDGTVRVWDTQGNPNPQILNLGNRFINDLNWSPEGTHILAATAEGIQVWEVATETLSQMLNIPDTSKNSFQQAAFSVDGTKIAGGGYSGNIEIWSVASGEHLLTLEGHGSYILDIAWSNDGTRLLSGSNDGTLRIWNVEDAVSTGFGDLSLSHILRKPRSHS